MDRKLSPSSDRLLQVEQMFDHSLAIEMEMKFHLIESYHLLLD